MFYQWNIPFWCICIFIILFFYLICFSLKDNCFTMLCWFLPCVNMNQSQGCICFFPIKAPSQPIPPLYVVTEHQVEFPMIISNFPLAICFTNGNLYISLLLSQFIPPSPAPAMSISLFSMSESLLYHFK